MATVASLASGPGREWPSRALFWIARLLVAASWISGVLFGVYILLFFGGTALTGAAERWNESLPGLHDGTTPLAVVAIGAHFLTGGLLLVLGPVQLIGAIRRTAPALHRWLGRFYVAAAAIAGVGGVGFILAKGTIGGTVMNLGFGLYGLLMVLCAALAFTHARSRRMEQHRAWAIRLFALTVGSWLYRMEYGFWFLTAGRVGHMDGFSGWFDMVMAFAFYLPNLAVAELFIRARRTSPGSAEQLTTAAVLLAASAFITIATWFFTIRFWGPGMASGLSGAPL